MWVKTVFNSNQYQLMVFKNEKGIIQQVLILYISKDQNKRYIRQYVIGDQSFFFFLPKLAWFPVIHQLISQQSEQLVMDYRSIMTNRTSIPQLMSFFFSSRVIIFICNYWNIRFFCHAQWENNRNVGTGRPSINFLMTAKFQGTNIRFQQKWRDNH